MIGLLPRLVWSLIEVAFGALAIGGSFVFGASASEISGPLIVTAIALGLGCVYAGTMWVGWLWVR